MAAFKGLTAAARTTIGVISRTFSKRDFSATQRLTVADGVTEPAQLSNEETRTKTATDDITETQQLLNKDNKPARPDSFGFFQPRWLFLDQYERRVDYERRRLGNRVGWFQQQMNERLDDENSHLLYRDCVSYLHLIDEQNIERAVQLIDRYDAQAKADADAGLDTVLEKEFPLHVDAIRKCHELNQPDRALEIFSRMEPTAGYVTALKLVLDILYKTGRFEDCAKLTVERMGSGDLKEIKLWFYDIGIISAYSMQSTEGLQLAAKLYDGLRAFATENVVRDRQLLMALYCIEQGHSNAALALIRSTESQHRLTQVVNLKVKVFLSGLQITEAIGLLRHHERALRSLRKEKEGVEEDGAKPNKAKNQHLLFRDVYFMLRDVVLEHGTPDQNKYLRYLSSNFNTFVHRSRLSYVLKGHILRLTTFNSKEVQPRLPAKKVVEKELVDSLETESVSEQVDESLQEIVGETVTEQKVETQGTPV